MEKFLRNDELFECHQEMEILRIIASSLERGAYHKVKLVQHSRWRITVSVKVKNLADAVKSFHFKYMDLMFVRQMLSPWKRDMEVINEGY